MIFNRAVKKSRAATSLEHHLKSDFGHVCSFLPLEQCVFSMIWCDVCQLHNPVAVMDFVVKYINLFTDSLNHLIQ